MIAKGEEDKFLFMLCKTTLQGTFLIVVARNFFLHLLLGVLPGPAWVLLNKIKYRVEQNKGS